MKNSTIRIDGVTYEIVRERQFQANGAVRTAIRMRRPNGKKFYEVVRYENGSLSSVVTCPFSVAA